MSREVMRKIAQSIENEDQARELLRAEAFAHTFQHGRAPTLEELAEFRRAINEAAFRLRVERAES